MVVSDQDRIRTHKIATPDSSAVRGLGLQLVMLGKLVKRSKQVGEV